jgi:DNA-binding CsgD family transcriptional regulator
MKTLNAPHHTRHRNRQAMNKQTLGEKLAECLQPKELHEPAADELRTGPVVQLGLTHRQGEIAEAVWRDLSNKEIGERLHCSALTIKAHLERIRLILGAKSKVGVALAWERARPSGLRHETVSKTPRTGAKI